MNQTCCAFQDCGGPQFKHGLCESHYSVIAADALGSAKKSTHANPPLLKTALYVFNRMTDNLIDRYRQAFALAPNEMLSIHLDDVENQVRKGSVDRAAESLHRAADFAPESPKISLHLGDLHLREGCYEDALSSYQSVHKTAPETQGLSEKIGEALCGLGRYDEAIEHFGLAIEQAPDKAGGYQRLGAALEAAGRTEDAIGAYERAVELAPSNARYLQSLGFTYEAVGNHEDALACFKRALEIER